MQTNSWTTRNEMMSRSVLDYEKCLIDPKGVFGTPERVLKDTRLDRRAKLEILHRWEHDARELAVAEDEAMAGGEPNMLDRVLAAIARLSSGDC